MKWPKSWNEFTTARCSARSSPINSKKIITTCRISTTRIHSSQTTTMARLNTKSRKLIRRPNKKWTLNKKVPFITLIITPHFFFKQRKFSPLRKLNPRNSSIIIIIITITITMMHSINSIMKIRRKAFEYKKLLILEQINCFFI